MYFYFFGQRDNSVLDAFFFVNQMVRVGAFGLVVDHNWYYGVLHDYKKMLPLVIPLEFQY